MRRYNREFGALNASSAKQRRYAIRIDMGGGSIVWVVSHADVFPGPGTILLARLSSISNVSQRLRPHEGRAEIGSLSFSAIDADESLSAELRSELLSTNRGALGKEVQLYIGDARIPFVRYELDTTQVLQSCRVGRSGTEYRFQCRDKQRAIREDVFDPVETRLTQNVSDTDTTITVASTAAFVGVDHGTSYSDAPSTDGVIYIEIDDEIIRTTAADATPTQFTNCVRGVLGTRPAAHTTDAGASANPDSGKRVREVVYFEMPVAKAAYAVMTGALLNQVGTWPSHWTAGMGAADVKLTDYTGIGPDVYDPSDDTRGVIFRFVQPGKQDAKRFLEKSLLFAAGLFAPVLADGQLGLRRLRRIVEGAAAVRRIDDSVLLRAPEITYAGEDIANEIELRWNKVDGDLTRSVIVQDATSIARFGQRKRLTIDAEGLHGSRHSTDVVVSLLSQAFDRRAGPPIRTTLQVHGSQSDIEIGDVVLVDTSHARDWTGNTIPLLRPFEVQGRNVNWRKNTISLSVEAASQAGDPLAPLTDSTSIPDAWFSSAGTNLAGVTGVTDRGSFLEVTSNITLAGGTDLTAPASVWYATKDVTVAAGVTITYSGNVQLRILGTMTDNGKLDGKGGGPVGVSDTVSTSGIVDYPTSTNPVDFDFQEGTPAGFGSTQAHGGLIERVRQENVGSGFFGVLQSVEAPVTSGQFDVMPLLALEYRDGDVQGLPTDLRGTSGGPGGLRYYEDTRPSPDTIQVNRGGTGGAGGAGLAVISRGFAFGASGTIDSSGNDGTVGAYNGADAQPAHAGGGAGGAPGGVLIVVDGRLNPAPSSIAGKVIANYGTAPLPTGDYASLPRTLLMDEKFTFGGNVPEDRFTRHLSVSSGVDATFAATRVQFMPAGAAPAAEQDDREIAKRQVVSLTATERYSDVADNGKTVIRLTVQQIDTDSAYSHSNIYGRTKTPSNGEASDGPWNLLGGAEPTFDVEVPADGIAREFVPVPVLANNLEADFSARGTGSTITVTAAGPGVSVAYTDITNVPQFFDQPTEPSALVSDDGDRWFDNDDGRFLEYASGWQQVATVNDGNLQRSILELPGVSESFVLGSFMDWTEISGDAPITIVGGTEIEFDEPGIYLLDLTLIVEDDSPNEEQEVFLQWEEKPSGGSWSDVTNGLLRHQNPQQFRYRSDHRTFVIASAANHRVRLEHHWKTTSTDNLDFDGGSGTRPSPTKLEILRLVQEPTT